MAENVAYYPQSAYLESCKIIVGENSYDLKNMVTELSYYEDVYSFCTSGYIMIRDGIGLIEAFKINGQQQLEIKFGKTANEFDNVGAQKFLVYKIGDRHPTGNMNSEFYKLYFCSPDLFRNEQIKISKSYVGQKINEIILDILLNKLKTEKRINVQKTTGYYDFIVPTLRPFESISWLSNYARPENSGKTGLVGADMFFFENRYGYNFSSLNTLMNKEPYNLYRYQQNNLDPDAENLQKENDSVLAVDFVKSFDTLKNVTGGAYANKIVAVDPLTKRYEVKEFDYLDYVSQISPTNGYNILPNIKDASGNYPNEATDSFYRVVLTNSNQKQTNYIKQNGEKGIAQDVFMEETLSKRVAQTTLANHTVLKIIVPGDINLTAGKTIDFAYYSMKLGEYTRELDPNYSGRYLITAVRHVLQSSGVYQSILEICKNSTLEPLAVINEIKAHK